MMDTTPRKMKTKESESWDDLISVRTELFEVRAKFEIGRRKRPKATKLNIIFSFDRQTFFNKF